MTQLTNVLAAIDDNLDNAVEHLFELLRIESISTDPAYKDECRKAAEWLVRDLQSIGFEASVRDTTGHPMVVAHHAGPKGAPHFLFYGHYDVQPVDPLELWEKPPFEPYVKELADGSKQLFGRGTSDDKGQLMTFVEACRAWKSETGGLPCEITILFEGEEESGSPSLEPFLDANKDELSTDFALVCDTGMFDRKTPAISTALRGMVTSELTIKAASRDLHSGHYGGAASNPLHLLSRIVADLHDDQGKVTISDFYEGVEDVPDEIRRQWDALGFDQTAFLGEIGLSFPAGEANRTVLEKIWARPTAEVNGMIGGYTGEGFKTVIAAQASAKISFRLVGKQDPDKIIENFKKFVQERLPEDCSAEFGEMRGAPAIQLDYKLPPLQKAAAALKDEWGRDTALIAMGGSIPIVGNFKSQLGMDSLLVGFGLDDDCIHSPNEKYELNSFHKGSRSWARILEALAK